MQASKSFVSYLWDDRKAAKLSSAEGLVYRSNLLGSDQRITNTGGGNTSAKLTEPDPLTGAGSTMFPRNLIASLVKYEIRLRRRRGRTL